MESVCSTSHFEVITPIKVEDDSRVSSESSEIFYMCDRENKGYVTREDLQRLQDIVTVSDDQLDEVFNTLDIEHKGRLTLDEFVDTFGMFLEIKANHSECKHLKHAPFVSGRSLSPIRELSSDAFAEFLEPFQCKDIFKNDCHLRSIWKHLSEKNPSMLSVLEEFLITVDLQLEEAKAEHRCLERTFSTCSNDQNEHLCQLHESLEKKMQTENERILAEEKEKHKKIRQELMEEVKLKDQLLSEVRKQHETLMKKVANLRREEAERKKENEKLLKEKDNLERKLISVKKLQKDMEQEIESINKENLDSKNRHESSINRVSTNIPLEEELIAMKVQNLHYQKKLLLDSKDLQQSGKNVEVIPLQHFVENHVLKDKKNAQEIEHNSDALCDDLNSEEMDIQIQFSNDDIKRKGSVLSDYFDFPQSSCSDIQDSTDFYSCNFENELLDTASVEQNEAFTVMDTKAVWKVTCILIPGDDLEMKKYWKVKLKLNHANSQTVIFSESVTDTCKNNWSSQLASVNNNLKKEPSSVYKVILIGDSGVGKTSFIHRFCNNSFCTSFQSTIGIDFQTKTITCSNQQVVLQLWDTAGQERFCSISKQYFRKADAVVLMYDVTSEQTFKNVRRWMENIMESAEEQAVVMLIGNKTDVKNHSIKEIIQSIHGAQLAKEYNILFFETSAKTGYNVNEAMKALTRSLQEREHYEMDKIYLQEESSQKKKWC